MAGCPAEGAGNPERRPPMRPVLAPKGGYTPNAGDERPGALQHDHLPATKSGVSRKAFDRCMAFLPKSHRLGIIRTDLSTNRSLTVKRKVSGIRSAPFQDGSRGFYRRIFRWGKPSVCEPLGSRSRNRQPLRRQVEHASYPGHRA